MADEDSCGSPADVDSRVAAETGGDLVRSRIRVLAKGRADFCCPWCGVVFAFPVFTEAFSLSSTKL